MNHNFLQQCYNDLILIPQRYYQDVYNFRLQFPTIFTVRLSETAVVPAEICHIAPGQLYKKKLTPEDQEEFLKFAQQRPGERLRDIKSAVNGPVCSQLIYNCAPY